MRLEMRLGGGARRAGRALAGGGAGSVEGISWALNLALVPAHLP